MGNLTQIVTNLEGRRTELQKELQRVDAAIDALSGLASGKRARVGRRGRSMSAAARKRISDAMKKKWAQRKSAA
jgi:predicted  nucleic acid-binding Zn-ribbon protein